MYRLGTDTCWYRFDFQNRAASTTWASSDKGKGKGGGVRHGRRCQSADEILSSVKET